MKKILIIEDDKVISDSIADFLNKYGYHALQVFDFQNAGEIVRKDKPHLVLLDIKLGNFDGFKICEDIRKFSPVPVIFITSLEDNLSYIKALSLGGDDLITKPFSKERLLMKIESLLRRTYTYGNLSGIEAKGYTLGEDMILRKNDVIVELTKNEYRILKILFENKGAVVSRNSIMESLWETSEFIDDNTLSVSVNRLRKKLADYGITDLIETKVGAGYRV